VAERIWGYLADNFYLRVCVARLGERIEADPARPAFIVTGPGVGNRLVVSNAASSRLNKIHLARAGLTVRVAGEKSHRRRWFFILAKPEKPDAA